MVGDAARAQGARRGSVRSRHHAQRIDHGLRARETDQTHTVSTHASSSSSSSLFLNRRLVRARVPSRRGSLRARVARSRVVVVVIASSPRIARDQGPPPTYIPARHDAVRSLRVPSTPAPGARECANPPTRVLGTPDGRGRGRITNSCGRTVYVSVHVLGNENLSTHTARARRRSPRAGASGRRAPCASPRRRRARVCARATRRRPPTGRCFF